MYIVNIYEYLSQTLTEPDLFKEAIQYVLPKSLMEPFYHFFYYFEVMNVSCACDIITLLVIYQHYMYLYIKIHQDNYSVIS